MEKPILQAISQIRSLNLAGLNLLVQRARRPDRNMFQIGFRSVPGAGTALPCCHAVLVIMITSASDA